MLKIEEVTGADALKVEFIISKEDAKALADLLSSYNCANYYCRRKLFTRLEIALEAELMEVNQ